MTKYVAFVEFEFAGTVDEAGEAVAEALRDSGLDTTDLDVGPVSTVQLSEPTPEDNIPNDPFKFPHIKQLMEALTLRGDRYAD